MLATLLTRRTTSLVPYARACWRHKSTSPAPNEDLVRVLTQYMEEEKASATVNAHKVRAYSKAIGAIGQLHEQVRSVDQVRHLEGIGVRIAKRIEAYLAETPYVREEASTPAGGKKPRKSRRQKTLDELHREQVVSTLTSISGIGSIKANALYDAGCRSLQDLREPNFLPTLSHAQQMKARYLVRQDHPVAHEQASAVCDFVAQNISSKFTVLLGGEFRRGLGSAQHITLLVLHPQNTGIFSPDCSPSIDSTIKQKGKYHVIPSPFASHDGNRVNSKALPDTATFLTEIISPLESRGLLAAPIAVGAQKWDGIVRIPERTKDKTGNGWETRTERLKAVEECAGQFFSAEIFYAPRQCAGAALIALTGDFEFNLAIRRAASQLGLRLNEYGLWRWQDKTSATATESAQKQWNVEEHGGHWELIASEKEEDIFEAVRMEYVAPERRNFVNLDGGSRKRKTRVF